jgi:hypothetical protein
MFPWALVKAAPDLSKLCQSVQSIGSADACPDTSPIRSKPAVKAAIIAFMCFSRHFVLYGNDET